MIDEPNAYAGLSLDEGACSSEPRARRPGPGRAHESFVVREDDHIDYLLAGARGIVPVTLAAKLRRSHFLFIGYGSTTGACASSCAASGAPTGSATGRGRWTRPPTRVACEFWRQRDVDVFDIAPAEYAAELAQRDRDLAGAGRGA